MNKFPFGFTWNGEVYQNLNTLDDNPIENVLVLQGGGSLGAYECGVYKTLSKYNIEFDIVAGTSIGALNAAIITAYKKGKEPVQELENFWLELSEKLIRLPEPFSSIYFNDEMRAMFASMFSAAYGNPKAFTRSSLLTPFNYFSFKSPYPLFDISPLKETLEKYVDFTTLSKNSQVIDFKTKSNISNSDYSNSKQKKEQGEGKVEGEGERPRLIVTSTNIQTSRPVIFDSFRANFDSNCVIASAGFPFYGIGWTKVDDKYLWDGALLSNTPLREVIDASPILDKMVYLISIFPHYQKQLPHDMFEAWHRARDIVYTDKTDSDIKNSKTRSRGLSLLKEMYELLLKYNNIVSKSNNNDDSKNDYSDFSFLSDELQEIEKKYFEIRRQRGSVIHKIVRIERPETTPFLFEDADFSEKTIKKLISQGEADTLKSLFP